MRETGAVMAGDAMKEHRLSIRISEQVRRLSHLLERCP
jgi:hypothetical protein